MPGKNTQLSADLINIEKRYEIKPEYTSRKEYHHYDDRAFEDEWQLEIYLHGLGLMTKYNFETVADIGCGSAFKLVTYFKNFKTIGYELPVNVDFLQEKYPNHDWRVSNFKEKNQIHVDIIICSDVIEHLVDPDELLEYLANQSFKYLIFSTPVRDLLYNSDSPNFNGPPGNLAHVREWKFDEFQRYISKHFDIIKHGITNYHQSTQMVICKLKDRALND